MSPCRFRGLGPYPLPNTVVPLAQPHHVAPWPISFQLEHISGGRLTLGNIMHIYTAQVGSTTLVYSMAS